MGPMTSWSPNRSPAPSPEWQRALATVGRGVLLVAGGEGRTAVARWLLGQLDRALPRVALVDASLEMPAVGVPGCVGLALTGPWRAPARLEFVGEYHALDRPLATASGVARLVRLARRRGIPGVIVDAGPVAGDDAGQDFLDHLTRLAEVDEVVWVGGALAPGRLPHLPVHLPVHRLAADPDRPRPDEAHRRAYREARLAAHFRGARLHRAALERLRRPCRRAERADPEPQPGRMLGLTAEDGSCLALGRLEEVAADHLALRTPLTGLEQVARVHLGGPLLDASDWPDQEAVEARLSAAG